MDGAVNVGVLRLLPLRCQKASLPDMSIQTNQVTYYGVPTKYPYENSTSSLSIDVISSGNLWEREFFTAWQNYIIDYGTKDKNPTFDVAYYRDFVTSAELDVYNADGEIVTTFAFDNIWPMTMTSVELDWSSKESLSFSVELAYSHWSIKSSKSEISTNIYEKTSVLNSLVDTVKILGLDKLRKTLNNLI